MTGKAPALLTILALFLLVALPVPAFAETAGSREVVITAADGQPLSGLLGRGGEANGAGVVLLPMYRQTKESWGPLLTVLNRRGFTTLALDLRGHGDSRMAPDGTDLSRQVAGRDPDLFNKMHLDAEAALRYLSGQGVAAERIGIVGASVGGSVAIDTITRGKVPVRAAVVMTPGREYLGIPTMTQIDNWPDIPLLILSSEEEAERGAAPIHRRLQGRNAELLTFPEEDIHGTNMFGTVAGVEELIADWLAAQLNRRTIP
jgi:dienelactone hydrolase